LAEILQAREPSPKGDNGLTKSSDSRFVVTTLLDLVDFFSTKEL
jgi:hypothetical protein